MASAGPRAHPPTPSNRIGGEINTGLADPKMQARFADLGGAPMKLAPAELSRLIVDETEKWAKVIRKANLKPA